MIAHFLGKTPLEVATTMTWPEVQALVEHWKYEPPLPVMIARYFEIEEREVESGEMGTTEAENLFRGMFAAVAAGGKAYEH